MPTGQGSWGLPVRAPSPPRLILREWELSAGASVWEVGRRTWQWWSKPTLCTSLRRPGERYGWWMSSPVLRGQPRRLPTQENSQWNTSSNCGTSSCCTPYPALGTAGCVGEHRLQVQEAPLQADMYYPAPSTLYLLVPPPMDRAPIAGMRLQVPVHQGCGRPELQGRRRRRTGATAS